MNKTCNNFLCFIDETGVLKEKNTQRFFALGLLKIQDTSELYSELWKLKNQVISFLERNKQFKQSKPFEFKFYDVNYSTIDFYLKLIDLYFTISNLYFCCFIIDKDNPKINLSFFDAWEYYIKFSQLIIKNNIKNNEKSFVIADFLGKPKLINKYWEQEIRTLENVCNACMIESHCSLFIQIVDVLVGATTYKFKVNRQGLTPNPLKQKLYEHIEKHLKIKDIGRDFTKPTPNYFSVWEFKPNKS